MVVINMGDYSKEVICDNCNKRKVMIYEIENINESNEEWISSLFIYDDEPKRKDFCCKKCYEEYSNSYKRRIK